MRNRAGGRVRGIFSRRGFGAGMVAVAMTLAAVLASLGLSHQLFWDDEANTAVYARNLLRFGRVTAWDGTNLMGYSFAGALGEDLGQELRVPPLPAYVAAAGLYFFGGTAADVTTYGPDTFRRLTVAGRLPFVVLGVLSLGLLAVWMRRHLGRRFPWWLPPLILALSPAYLLYIRNCRYYALGVMLSIAVWTFWAPGTDRGRPLDGSRRARIAWLARCAGAATAMVLLIFTHYLNAASVLVTLPLFFLDVRYRRPRQYMLLGVIYAAAAVTGGWILLTAYPFAAKYQAATRLGYWEHFYTNAGWFIRDVGTYEFVPWVLVLVFVLPWLLPRLRRLRPLAVRAWILVGLVLAYAVLAGLLTPMDMGYGPTAEIRYVVPLVAVGAVLGAMAVAILWRWCRPVAAAALLLLVATNFLYLGFLAERADETSSWWPPILARYLDEAFHDFETGNEELIGRLAQLPPGTTVRTLPTVCVYPAMFYVPELHYCDQLREGKQLRAELGPMPEYLFQTANPDVVFVNPNGVYWASGMLVPEGSYELTGALARFWQFMSKPGIPNHFFSYPTAGWYEYPGMAVLVRSDSALMSNPAVTTDPTDADALARWGGMLADADRLKQGMARLNEAVRLDPECFEAHAELGRVLLLEGDWREASEHLRVAVRLNPNSAEARVGYGAVLRYEGDLARAAYQFREAVRLRPRWPVGYYNLGQVFLDRGETEEAIRLFRKALALAPDYSAAHAELGGALLMQGHIDEAIEHLRWAVRVDPEFATASSNLGLALLKKADALAAQNENDEADALRYEAVMHFSGALQFARRNATLRRKSARSWSSNCSPRNSETRPTRCWPRPSARS